eukprot:gene29041-36100_t
MEPYSPSSKSESPRSSISDLWDDSKKSTSVSDEDEKMEEYSTPDTKLPEKEEEEIPQSDLRAKLNARKSHNSRGEQPQQKKGDIPPIGRVLHKIAKVLGGKQNPGDDQEEQIKDILGKWYKDRRAVVLAEDPASIELKLGLPVEEDGIH